MLIVFRRLALDPKWCLVGLFMVLVGLGGIPILCDSLNDMSAEGSILGVIVGPSMLLMFGGFGVALTLKQLVLRSKKALTVEFAKLRIDNLLGVSACDPDEELIPSFCPVFVFSGPECDVRFWDQSDGENEEPGPDPVCVAAEGLRVVSFLPFAKERIWRRTRRLARWLDVPVVELPASSEEQRVYPVGEPGPRRSAGKHVLESFKGLGEWIARIVLGLLR